MPTPRRGEVWLVDFGLAGKTRPALVVSVAFGDRDRSLITVVPHTTSLRCSPFEIGAARALHRLGTIPSQPFEKVFGGLLWWPGHFPHEFGELR
jgi:mRNA interferase MazF